MPSLTPIVLNLKPTIPASSIPCFTASDSLNNCILHVLPSYQTEDIPTWGLDMSSFDRPTPWRIAYEPPWDFGSVILELYLLSLYVAEVGGREGSAVTGDWTWALTGDTMGGLEGGLGYVRHEKG
ncbi:hypothetical protein SLA2020_256440 [Shorea laevis]